MVIYRLFQVVFEDCALDCLETFGPVPSIMRARAHTHRYTHHTQETQTHTLSHTQTYTQIYTPHTKTHTQGRRWLEIIFDARKSKASLSNLMVDLF